MATPSPQTQHMAVQRAATPKPALPTDREVVFKAFASDLEVRLNIAMILTHICIPTKAGHRCTESEAMKFMMMCKARRLNPWEGDAFLQGYDSAKGPQFSLITAHQAFLKRAEASKEYDGKESGVLVIENGSEGQEIELVGDYYNKDRYTLVGGWCRVFKKNQSRPEYKRLALETFHTGYGRWEKDAAGMIVKCAEADSLRSAFPSVLGDLYLAEELNFGERNVTPSPQIPPSFLSPPSTPPSESETKPAEPKEPEPSEPPPQEPPTEPTPNAAEDMTEGKSTEEVIGMLKAKMQLSKVSEDQFTAYCRSVPAEKGSKARLAKDNQQWHELAASKLRMLANEFDARLVNIRDVTV